MFPWGALVGLAGQAVSGIASAINNRKQQAAADAEAARQKAYYDAKASENPLSRSENQYLLGQYDREAQQQIENARGVAAIKGMTPEYSLGVQKAVAEGRANLMGKMSAGASQRADYFKEKGEQARHAKELEDQQRRAARQQTYANLAANAVAAAGGIIDSYGAGGASKAPKNETQGSAPLPTLPERHLTKPSVNLPFGNNAAKMQTQSAITTKGVDFGNLHVDQNGNVTNKFDWINRLKIK